MGYPKHTWFLSLLSVSLITTSLWAETSVPQPEEVVNALCQCLNSGLSKGSKSLSDCYSDYLSKVNVITSAYARENNSKSEAEMVSNHIREKTAECLNQFTGIQPGQDRDSKPVLPTLHEFSSENSAEAHS